MNQFTMPNRGVSFDSTSTMRAASEQLPAFHSESEMETDTDQGPMIKPRFIIATDFGTTFSSVAFLQRTGTYPTESRLISNFEKDPIALQGHLNVQVPTESWYIQEDFDPSEEPLNEQFKGEDSDDLYEASDDESRAETSNFDRDDQMDVDVGEPVAEPRKLHWGYQVSYMISGDMDRSKVNRLARFKLLLDRTDHTQDTRDELKPILDRLKKSKIKRKAIIRRDEDVIADYLTELFRHTKKELQKMDIPTDAEFEHVLCVPAIWDSNACQEMQTAVSIAVERSGLGSMDDFFLVTEPEAAAAFVLADPRNTINNGETFLLLDAGGGTVDVTMYKVEGQNPLRLSSEIIPADGCFYGSGVLNEEFRRRLRKRLEGVEKDIEKDNYTLDGILDETVKEFEQTIKRRVDISGTTPIEDSVSVRGLRPSAKRRFRKDKVILERRDFEKIFNPCLDNISALMESQITIARNTKGVEVNKVILVGGFSESQALRTRLEKRLQIIGREHGHRIKLIWPEYGRQTAVVQGAIIRAWDKENGPKRYLQMSYGFLVTEEYNPDVHEAHNSVKCPTWDKRDGLRYVHDTIEWVVCKDDKVHVDNKVVKSIVVYHIFDASCKRLECVETLWVSPTCTESHYKIYNARRGDEHNKDARRAGRIVADVTHLRTEGKIQPILPEPGTRMRKHYKVELQLFLIIEGRNLRFEARWPAGENGQKMAEGQVSIAAAFKPGTQ